MNNLKWAILVLLLFAYLPGCTLRPSVENGFIVPSKQYPDFWVVRARPTDDFSSLAKRYLNDSSKGWAIAEFNHLDRVQPNQDLLIPIEPFRPGGLSLGGYQTVPILTYHNFSKTKSNKMTVLKSDFEQQMRYLREHDYHVISMKDFLAFLEFKQQIPEKSVLITVDDGWKAFYTIAYPILKKYNYPATLFVYTDLIDGRGSHLSWQQIKKMSENRIEMQCHTLSHRYLNKRKPGENYLQYAQEIERELKESAELIESKTGKKVDLLAYPYGESNYLVVAYALKLGYQGAFSVNPQPNAFFVPRFRINRTMIFGDYDIDRFRSKLRTFAQESF
jgi:peptidoglycan/xylan/chitin deacetylase (PgdA/CDA1 family)